NLSTFLHEFAHFMLEAEASGSETDLRVTKWLFDNAEAGATETNSILNELADPELHQKAYHASTRILNEFSVEAASREEGFGAGAASARPLHHERGRGGMGAGRSGGGGGGGGGHAGRAPGPGGAPARRQARGRAGALGARPPLACVPRGRSRC